MPSSSERLDVLERINLLVVQDVSDLWKQLAASDLTSMRFRAAMMQAVPEVIQPYESVTGELAARWYEEAAPELPYRATPAALSPTEQLAASTRWALGAAGDAALSRLAGFAQRAIFGAARETVLTNSQAESGSTWARHASGNACAFCRMMATRGDVYASKASATTTGGNKYHDKCHCIAVEVRPGKSYQPPSYVEQWQEEYRAAVRATGKVGEHGAIDPTSVLSHMREFGTASH